MMEKVLTNADAVALVKDVWTKNLCKHILNQIDEKYRLGDFNVTEFISFTLPLSSSLTTSNIELTERYICGVRHFAKVSIHTNNEDNTMTVYIHPRLEGD